MVTPPSTLGWSLLLFAEEGAAVGWWWAGRSDRGEVLMTRNVRAASRPATGRLVGLVQASWTGGVRGRAEVMASRDPRWPLVPPAVVGRRPDAEVVVGLGSRRDTDSLRGTDGPGTAQPPAAVAPGNSGKR